MRIEREPPTPYNPQRMRALWRPIREALLIKTHMPSTDDDDDDAEATMGLDYDTDMLYGRRAAFEEAVVGRARLFVEQHVAVPERWWPAAMTCAFLDCAYAFGISSEDQTSWQISDWCTHWREASGGDVDMTPMQLLHFFMQWTWWRNTLVDDE